MQHRTHKALADVPCVQLINTGAVSISDSYIFEQGDVEIFRTCDHKTICSEGRITGCWRRFMGAAEESSGTGDLRLSCVYRILGLVCSVSLIPSERNAPFAPFWRSPTDRGFLPEDLTDQQILFLTEILECIEPVWLKARVADILWLVCANDRIVYARTALDNYQLLPLSPETWRRDRFGACWERAYSLSLQIRHTESSTSIKARLQAEIESGSSLLVELARVLDNGRISDDELDALGSVILQRAKELSDFDERESDSGFLKRFWVKIKSIFFRRDLPIESRRELSVAITLAKEAVPKFTASSNALRKVEALSVLSWIHEKEGDNRTEGDLGSHLGALYCYQDALHAIRQIPSEYKATYDVDSIVKGLRKKIRRAGLHAESHLSSVQMPTGVTPEIVRESENHIKGAASVDEAVFRYSQLFTGPQRADWMSEADKLSSEFALGGLFGATHLGDGRVVAQEAASGLGDAVSEQRSEEDARVNFLRVGVPFNVRGMLLPGHSALLSEHVVPLNMMFELARRSRLVADDRVYLVGFGLHRGFEFDFASAVHILAPQLEKMVRDMVRDRGGSVSTIDSSGIESYIALGSLLDKPEALDALGEDLLFEIKSIFTDQRGPNIRNDVAHGEMSDSSSQGDFSIYAWWLILRIICKSVLDGAGSTDQQDDDS